MLEDKRHEPRLLHLNGLDGVSSIHSAPRRIASLAMGMKETNGC